MESSAAEQVQVLLSLDTGQARRAWLEQHVPQRDEALVCALREEVDRRKRDNPHEALQIAGVMANAATVWRDRRTEAEALHIEADVRSLLDQHKAALDLYERAAALFRSLGLELEAAHVAVGQIGAMWYLGLYEEALALADWAADVFRAAGDRLALGKIAMNRGNILVRLSRFEEARAGYAEARDLFTALGDARHLAMVNVNDANVLTELDDFRQAERMFEAARAYFEAEGMASATAQVDLDLAYLYFAQGDYQRALATFNRAREIYTALNSASDVAYVDLRRSDVYLALNLWREALEQARKARPVFEAAGMAWEAAHLWLNEAVALAHSDGGAAPSEALGRAQRLFAQQQHEMGLALTDLCRATFALREGNAAAAREAALRAREVFQRTGQRSRAAQCDVILGRAALLEGAVSQAAACFSCGLSQLEQADVPAVSFACFYGLGCSEETRHRYEAARQYYHRAIADIERLQAAIGAEGYKIAFLQDKLQVYEAAVLLALRHGTPEAVDEAFETVERAKSRALLDALARGPAVLAERSAEASLWAEIDRLKGELNWYYNRLYAPQPGEGRAVARVAELTAAITQRERELKRLLDRWRSPDLATAPRNPIGAATPAQVRAILPDDALLLEFYSARDQVFVFGISRDETWVQRLPAAYSEVAETLSRFYFQIAKFSYGPAYREKHAAMLLETANRQLQRLYEALFLPIAGDLTAETLIVVPHGVLHHVPFQALFDGGCYLIDEKAISYAPSATVLHRVLSNGARGNGRPPLVLGVSDPTIPYALVEAQAIATLFPDADVRLGERATVAALLENEKHPAFLHLSTHAAFRSDNPLFSALRLADGWVTVNDIYGLADSAPLVTLSACETGRSQVVAGDELVGLCRGFFSAGARSLVVSLWTVDDDSAARLMRRFYEELLAGRPVNQALRTAQLAIKAETGHPYYWAPFVLTGDIHTRLSPAYRVDG